jgi:hypothetical protein
MNRRGSLLDELRSQYETVPEAANDRADRLERVTLEFPSPDIDEPMLEDLVRLILGRDSAFLKRAPLAGLNGRASG